MSRHVSAAQFTAVESLWEQGLCASVYEGKWISKVWAKNHLGCMSVSELNLNTSIFLLRQNFQETSYCYN